MPTFIKTGFWEKTCQTCNGYKGWLNLDQFIGGSGSNGTSGVSGTSGLTGTSGSAGTSGASGTSGSAGTSGLSGTSGSSGLTGTSGLSGDKYYGTSTTQLTLGENGTIFVQPGLAYSVAQDIIISNTLANHQHAYIVSYNSITGELVFGDVHEVSGSGTFSSWIVNLAGASGGNGTAGTSGSAGTSGLSGTSGVAGTSGSAGTSGATGTNGSSGTSALGGTSGINGTSGQSGTAGVSGTSGTSFTPPLPVVYALYAQTANSTTVTNTTAETTIVGTGVGSLSVPANGFSIGDSFRAILGGVINAGNNQTIRIRLKTGSVVLLDSGAQNLGSAVIDDVWSLNVDFTIRQLGTAGVASIVSLGSFHYTKTNNASVQGFGFNVANNTTFNTTISNTLDITVEWGSASTGNNIYSDTFVLNKIY